MTPTKKWLALASAALLLSGCGRGEKKEAAKGPAKVDNPKTESQLTTITLTEEAVRRLGIETAETKVGRVFRTRTLGGEIVPPSGSLAPISAPFAGTLLAPPQGALPMAGARVARNQTLARLLPLPSPAEIASAQARVEAARAKEQRAAQLVKDGAGSVRAHEEAAAELAVIEATLRAARPMAEGRNSDAPALQSPLDGVLHKVLVVEGQPVQAGAPLFEVVAQGVVWVRVPLYAGDRNAIQLSAGAEVYDLSNEGETPLQARAVEGPPTADARSSTVDAYFELNDRRQVFRPGQRVNVRLKTKSQDDATLVPWSSILYDFNGGTWVYENPEPRKYVRRRVEVKYRDGSSAALRSGPQAGTQVVAVGAAELFGTELGSGK